MDASQQPGNTPHDNQDDWEAQVDAETEARQHKIQRLRIAEAGSGEYDDEKKPHRFLHFLGWMLLIVVLIAGGAFAGWYFWLRHIEPEKSATTAPPPAPPPAAVEAPTENYNATAFQLMFDYPADWKVTETTTNKALVTSPNMQLKAITSGGAIKSLPGQVIMTIQHKQSSVPELANGDLTAIRESEHMEYAHPSQAQRAATYLSFLNYAASASKGQRGIDAVYVTGDSGYIKDQLIPQADIVKGDPLISLTFRSCSDTKCGTPGQPVVLAPSAWDDQNFVKPVRTMLQSIVVQ